MLTWKAMVSISMSARYLDASPLLESTIVMLQKV